MSDCGTIVGMAQVLPAGKRVIVSEYGETPLEALDSFVKLESTEPFDTASVGRNEVLVHVRAAQVGWVDLLMTSGQYQHMPDPPYVPGLEYAGLVAFAGADVRVEGRPLETGERVLVDPFLAGPRSHGKYRRSGGFATHALVPEEAVIRVPPNLSLEEACNLLGNYETAYHCLVARGRLRVGETVLVNGATGATGLAAVRIAKLLGATVIATGRSHDKLQVVREQGADHVIALGEAEGGPRSLRDQVKAIVPGGVDVVYDGVGGEISQESLRCVAFGARFLVVGWASTPFVAKGKGGRGAPNANVLPTNLVLMKGLDVLGCPTAISTVHDPSIRAERLAKVLAWASEGKIRPLVARSFPLESYDEAMRAKWNNAFTGGVVLVP